MEFSVTQKRSSHIIHIWQDYIFPPYTTSNPMPNKWSGCSVDDFRAHYQLFKSRDGQYCVGQGPKVCINVKVTTKDWGSENSWTFGSCSSKQLYTDNPAVYDVQCCQPLGNYKLTCKDLWGDGWHGGFIQVGGSDTKHCQDFTSGQSKEVANVAHTTKCIDMKLVTKTWGEEISWSFGSCSSTQTYANNKEYDIKCCQPPGKYDFKCIDSYGDGWHGGYIRVPGTSTINLCQDFTTGRSKTVTNVEHWLFSWKKG